MLTPGQAFRDAVAANDPLPIVGAINAYSAMLAERAGHQAIYLSGAGVANASYGLPDLGMTSLDNVLTDASRITDACDLPLLVDIDTGWGGAFNISRTVRQMENAGVAAVHIEDQVAQKRCGHRPNKEIVSTAEMQDRVRAAVDARDNMIIMARTDALAGEGLEAAIARCVAYVEAGADMIFAEAMTDLNMYKAFTDALDVPVLANITEFGKTELYSQQQLASVGIKMALYPLSAFRAMSQAAILTYEAIKQTGTQEVMVDAMQTRKDLYDVLGYHHYEDKLDALFGADADPDDDTR